MNSTTIALLAAAALAVVILSKNGDAPQSSFQPTYGNGPTPANPNALPGKGPVGNPITSPNPGGQLQQEAVALLNTPQAQQLLQNAGAQLWNGITGFFGSWNPVGA